MLTGTVVVTDPAGAVIDAGGVGYRVFLPTGSIAALPPAGSRVTVHTHLHVREDAMILFGFATAEERDVFEILIGVNGIGPKGALAILSAYAPEALRKAVVAEDLDALTLIPGVGKKTAARMVLELKEKLGGDAAAFGDAVPEPMRPVLAEARDALVALGYSTSEARSAVESVAERNGRAPGVEELLRRALKHLGGAR